MGWGGSQNSGRHYVYHFVEGVRKDAGGQPHEERRRVLSALASSPWKMECTWVSPTWGLPEPHTLGYYGGFLTEAWSIISSISSSSLVWRMAGPLKIPSFCSWLVTC